MPIADLIKQLGDNNLNVPEADGLPCKRCGKVPPVRVIKEIIVMGKVKVYKDRSSRVDCDISKGKQSQRLETFCKRCYIKELLKHIRD